eukprot:6200787-Pleurochrysis_carterae.AAC.2
MEHLGPTNNAGVLHKSGPASTKTKNDEPFRTPKQFTVPSGAQCQMSTPSQDYLAIKACHGLHMAIYIPLILYFVHLLYDADSPAGGPRQHWTIAACKVTRLPATDGGGENMFINSLPTGKIP